MERPYISSDESPECDAIEAYEDYLDAEESAGGDWISFEEFQARFPPAPPPVAPVVELPEEDDIAW